ncbi:MAG: sulfate permease, partial [Candidatus Krumholzibacteriales bacterium]
MNLRRFKVVLTINRWLEIYSGQTLRKDLQAGLTVGVMLIPQCMAYAVIAGLPPVYGLYASLIPLLVYPFFGTSRHLALGVVALDMIIIAAGVGKIAVPGSQEYISLVIVLTLLVGLVQVIMSWAKLGFLVNYLSRPVIVGFTSAAAVIIIFGQAGNLLGIDIQRSSYPANSISELFLKAGSANLLSLLIGGSSIILILIFKFWKPLFPKALAVIIIATALSFLLEFPSYGVETAGRIPPGLPPVRPPSVNISALRQLFSTAVTLALVQFMTVVSLGKTYAARHRYSIDSNRELFALSLSNIFNSFLRGMPVSASFSRTAVNEQAGSRTPISNIFAASVVLITLLFLTPAFEYLPTAALAAIVITAAINLIDVNSLKWLMRTKRSDGLIALSTFIITLVIGIQEGILIGIAVSLLALLYRESYPNVAELGHLLGTRSFKDLNRFAEADKIEKIMILRIDASFSFTNAEFFKDYILSKSLSSEEEVEAVIIDGSAINDLDTTALDALRSVIETLR